MGKYFCQESWLKMPTYWKPQEGIYTEIDVRGSTSLYCEGGEDCCLAARWVINHSHQAQKNQSLKKHFLSFSIKRFGSRECQAGEGDCSRDSDCSGTLVFGGNCLTCWFSMFYILLYVDFLCFILFNIVFSGTLQLQCLQTTIAVSCIYKDE